MKLAQTGIVILLAVLVATTSGCGVINRIRAKNQLNEAAQAYREGRFVDAEQHSRQAAELDPNNKTAPMFIARTIHAQYRPGVQSPENIAKAQEAIQAYQALLDADPNHAEAKGAVRQIGFLRRATSRAPGAIVAADAAPDDIEVAFAAADVDILQQNVAAAFDRLIALIKRTAGDERTKVRTRLIELFDLFDPADPEVIAGRRKLANALY